MLIALGVVLAYVVIGYVAYALMQASENQEYAQKKFKYDKAYREHREKEAERRKNSDYWGSFSYYGYPPSEPEQAGSVLMGLFWPFVLVFGIWAAIWCGFELLGKFLWKYFPLKPKSTDAYYAEIERAEEIKAKEARELKEFQDFKQAFEAEHDRALEVLDLKL